MTERDYNLHKALFGFYKMSIEHKIEIEATQEILKQVFYDFKIAHLPLFEMNELVNKYSFMNSIDGIKGPLTLGAFSKKVSDYMLVIT